MSLDIEKIRAQTPALAHVTHLLACGSALVPEPVHNAVIDHLNLEAKIGGYEAHAKKADQLDRVYDSLATLINADRQEIAIHENATAAWCHAFYALPLKAGDKVLTGQAEYAANYVAMLQRAKRDGIIIEVVPSTEQGDIDLTALKNKIDKNTALIALTWVPTNGGLVNPASAVGEVARQNNIPYLLDACQAVGQMPVDVNEIGCDFLSATGRKFLRGPRGTGFLYIKNHFIEKLEPVVIDHFAAPWIDTDEYALRSDARRFENWENSYALRAGLATAADYANDIGLETIRQRAWGLADYFRELLDDIKTATCQDIGTKQCAIVSFTLDGINPGQLVEDLRKKGIMIGASNASSTRLDSTTRGLPTLLRVAPHYYNTHEELESLIMQMKSIQAGRS